MIQTYDIFISDGALVSERHPHGMWCNAGEVESHISAQAATIELLRAEVRARRELWGCLEMLNGVHNLPAFKSVVAARAATDAANALEEQ